MAVGALAGAAGGLEEGFKNYQEARQQNETMQQESLTNLQSSMPLYQAVAQADPGKLSDPSYIQGINKQMKQAGINAQFDPSKPLPTDFLKPDYFYKNPDVYARTMMTGRDNFANNLTHLLATSDKTNPKLLLAGIMALAQSAKSSGVDPAEITSQIEQSGAMEEITTAYQDRLDSLNAGTNLKNQQKDTLHTMLQYRVQNEIAKTGLEKAETNYYNARPAYMSGMLAVARQRVSQQGALGMNSLQIQWDRLNQQGQHASNQDRINMFNAMTKAATERRQLAQAIATDLNNPTTAAGLSTQQIDQMLTEGQQYQQEAAAIDSQKAGLGSMPQYKPAPLPGNQQVKQSLPMQHPDKVYFITAGKNKGKYVHAGQIGTKDKPDGTYTPDPSDKYTLVTKP